MLVSLSASAWAMSSISRSKSSLTSHQEPTTGASTRPSVPNSFNLVWNGMSGPGTAASQSCACLTYSLFTFACRAFARDAVTAALSW